MRAAAASVAATVAVTATVTVTATVDATVLLPLQVSPPLLLPSASHWPSTLAPWLLFCPSADPQRMAPSHPASFRRLSRRNLWRSKAPASTVAWCTRRLRRICGDGVFCVWPLVEGKSSSCFLSVLSTILTLAFSLALVCACVEGVNSSTPCTLTRHRSIHSFRSLS